MRRIFGWDFERYRSLQGRSPSKSAGCTRIGDRETELPGWAKGKRISEKIGVALWVCSVSNAQPKLHLFCLIPHFMMHAEQPIAVPLPCFFRVNYRELNRHFQFDPCALSFLDTPPACGKLTHSRIFGSGSVWITNARTEPRRAWSPGAVQRRFPTKWPQCLKGSFGLTRCLHPKL